MDQPNNLNIISDESKQEEEEAEAVVSDDLGLDSDSGLCTEQTDSTNQMTQTSEEFQETNKVAVSSSLSPASSPASSSSSSSSSSSAAASSSSPSSSPSSSSSSSSSSSGSDSDNETKTEKVESNLEKKTTDNNRVGVSQESGGGCHANNDIDEETREHDRASNVVDDQNQSNVILSEQHYNQPSVENCEDENSNNDILTQWSLLQQECPRSVSTVIDQIVGLFLKDIRRHPRTTSNIFGNLRDLGLMKLAQSSPYCRVHYRFKQLTPSADQLFKMWKGSYKRATKLLEAQGGIEDGGVFGYEGDNPQPPTPQPPTRDHQSYNQEQNITESPQVLLQQDPVPGPSSGRPQRDPFLPPIYLKHLKHVHGEYLNEVHLHVSNRYHYVVPDDESSSRLISGPTNDPQGKGAAIMMNPRDDDGLPMNLSDTSSDESSFGDGIDATDGQRPPTKMPQCSLIKNSVKSSSSGAAAAAGAGAAAAAAVGTVSALPGRSDSQPPGELSSPSPPSSRRQIRGKDLEAMKLLAKSMNYGFDGDETLSDDSFEENANEHAADMVDSDDDHHHDDDEEDEDSNFVPVPALSAERMVVFDQTTKKYLFRCKYTCGEGKNAGLFSTSSNAKRHEQHHCKSKNAITDRVDDLIAKREMSPSQREFWIRHKLKGYFQCKFNFPNGQVCQRKYSSRAEQESCRKEHEKNQSMICPTCGRDDFKKRQLFYQHKISCTGDQTKRRRKRRKRDEDRFESSDSES